LTVHASFGLGQKLRPRKDLGDHLGNEMPAARLFCNANTGYQKA
jgi:hypothetical protein